MKARTLRLPATLGDLQQVSSRGYTRLETERSGPNVDIGVSGLDPDPEHLGIRHRRTSRGDGSGHVVGTLLRPEPVHLDLRAAASHAAGQPRTAP